MPWQDLVLLPLAMHPAEQVLFQVAALAAVVGLLAVSALAALVGLLTVAAALQIAGADEVLPQVLLADVGAAVEVQPFGRNDWRQGHHQCQASPKQARSLHCLWCHHLLARNSNFVHLPCTKTPRCVHHLDLADHAHPEDSPHHMMALMMILIQILNLNHESHESQHGLLHFSHSRHNTSTPGTCWDLEI